MSFKNTIYYNHTNELCFNWLSYEPQATKESFRAFCNAITESDFHKLPKGIKFVLKEHDKEVLTFSK